jgi:hypothetical protein
MPIRTILVLGVDLAAPLGTDERFREDPSMGRLLSAGLVVCIWLGCAQSTQFFHDRAHRATYDLQPQELRSVQFYASEEILAHEVGASGALEGPDHVYIVASRTRGTVTDAGPHWLRVSFGPGEGVLFLAKPDARTDSIYMLATEGDSGGAAVRVKDLADPIVTVGKRRFRVIRGVNASLLIDDGDLSRLIEARAHAPGRDPSR